MRRNDSIIVNREQVAGLTSYNHSHNLKWTKFTCFLFYLHGILPLSFKDTVVVPSLIIMNEFSTRRTDLPTSLVGERNDNPLQYSCLGNPTDREVWQATVHGVTKSRDMTERLYSQVQVRAFQVVLMAKNLTASAADSRDVGSIPG